MNTYPLYLKTFYQSSCAPRTARGRALYTIAWLLNGVTPKHDCDDSTLTLKGVITC